MRDVPKTMWNWINLWKLDQQDFLKNFTKSMVLNMFCIAVNIKFGVSEHRFETFSVKIRITSIQMAIFWFHKVIFRMPWVCEPYRLTFIENCSLNIYTECKCVSVTLRSTSDWLQMLQVWIQRQKSSLQQYRFL